MYRTLRTILMLAFIAAVIGAVVYSRIVAYSLAPTMKSADFHGLAPWEIPIAYIIDYLSHGIICLLFAFVAAGLIYEFMPKEFVTKRMASGKAGYAIGVLVAPFFTVCSCTMVPIFAGILYSGSGIGPALAFLLMAPAANILTIVMTGEMLSWELAGVRIVAALITAITAGFIVSRTPWGREVEKRLRANSGFTDAQVQGQVSSVEVVKPPLDTRLWTALSFGGYLGRQILPWFFLGLVAVSYLEAYLPEELVATHLTGIGGVLLASVIGGPLYTPTLVEIVLGKGLMDLGMTKPVMLSWLMGQPYDVPNMIATSRIIGWKPVITYALVAWSFSVLCGLAYGLIAGGL